VIAAAALPAPALALTIHFNTGDAALNPRARAALDKLVAQVTDHPEWRLAVEGHADARGDEAVNERLSQERAQVVSARLEKLGLPGARVQTAAFGSTRPLSPGDDAAALRRNRRVEVLIVRGEP
jgi:outer membrane protein OmpA-like peptidoglycan-associated protein